MLFLPFHRDCIEWATKFHSRELDGVETEEDEEVEILNIDWVEPHMFLVSGVDRDRKDLHRETIFEFGA
jgi:hypothetical protein